jgi:hypothetical protein
VGHNWTQRDKIEPLRQPGRQVLALDQRRKPKAFGLSRHRERVAREHRRKAGPAASFRRSRPMSSLNRMVSGAVCTGSNPAGAHFRTLKRRTSYLLAAVSVPLKSNGPVGRVRKLHLSPSVTGHARSERARSALWRFDSSDFLPRWSRIGRSGSSGRSQSSASAARQNPLTAGYQCCGGPGSGCPQLQSPGVCSRCITRAHDVQRTHAGPGRCATYTAEPKEARKSSV